MNPSSFKTNVAGLVRRINDLVLKLGGKGASLLEASASIHAVLDEYESRQLKFIATVHQKLAGAAGFKMHGEERFIDTCEWIIARLEAHLKVQEQQRKTGLSALIDGQGNGPAPAASRLPRKARHIGLIAAGAGAMCLLVLPFCCTRSVQRSEWPYSSVYSDSAPDWPPVIFWTVMSATATFQTLKWMARR